MTEQEIRKALFEHSAHIRDLTAYITEQQELAAKVYAKCESLKAQLSFLTGEPKALCESQLNKYVSEGEALNKIISIKTNERNNAISNLKALIASIRGEDVRSTECRRMLTIRFLDGNTVATVAYKLHRSNDYVKRNLMQRALKMIAESLQQ